MKITTTLSLSFLLSASYLPGAMAADGQRHARLAERHDHDQGDQVPAPPPKFAG